MRRLSPAAALLVVLAAGAAHAAPVPPDQTSRRTGSRVASRSWAQAEIRLVVSRGLMSPTVGSFRPEDPITQGELNALVAGLTNQPAQRPADPSPVTLAQLDARLVGALGFSDSAAVFLRTARRAGLAPPARFGTEAVARMLGLRTNHPARRDDLELLPIDLATRAEAAFSAARILRFRGGEAQALAALAASFVLPAPSAWQKRVLATAVRFIGFPYVWGGSSEGAEAPFGVPARGGFDCSGFVWRVYKVQAYSGGEALPTVLRGRTTYAMSAEVTRAKRIPFARLVPGDVLFFGARGPASKPAAVDHMGIYLGGGWIIHSSSQGVALTTLSGWYRHRFAWGRRLLAEAGLEPPR